MSKRAFENIKIENLSHDGRGICRIEGKTVFVENALPQEMVNIEITRTHNKYDEAKATKIINPGAIRTTAPCNFFQTCGGCSLQHIDAQAQIDLKQTFLLEQLKHFGKVEPKHILPPLVGPNYGYRHKARLSVRYVEKKQSVLVGFREKNSHFVNEMSFCQVLKPALAEIIQPLRELLFNFQNKQNIPQIELAADEHKNAVIVRHLKPFTQEELHKFISFAKNYELHLFLQPGNYNSIHMIYPQDHNHEDFYLHYDFPHHDIKFQFKPTEFCQINPVINEKMVDQALTLLDINEKEEILDLFCGFGNFTLPIARYAKKVMGIEGNESAIVRARANALNNNLDNTLFLQEDLKQPQLSSAWKNQNFAKILIDPPRSGAVEMLSTIAKLNPKRLVYVSCNPATLARDLGILVNQFNFQLISAGVMDMFPQTSHVESIALLSTG